MRYIILACIMSLAVKGKCQGYSTERQDTTNVYHKALVEFCEYVEQYFPNVREVVIESTALNTMFPEKIGNISIRYIQRCDVKREFKKGTLRYYNVITPMRVQSGQFLVSVIPFKVSYKDKRKDLNYISNGGVRSIFEYDCTGRQLMFSSSEGGFPELQ
jgi:hypothetical protein